MMTPRGLLNLANDLCADDREEAWRTAASRAYYAVFHAAAELLDHADFEVPNADTAHAYLWLRLQNSGHPDVIAAGVELKELRAMRNEADYDRHVDFTHGQATAQVLTAFRILDLLEAVMNSPETLNRITPVIRAYERDVLHDVSYRGTP
jgi:uncharacterized protein (UPF0332 family)